MFDAGRLLTRLFEQVRWVAWQVALEPDGGLLVTGTLAGRKAAVRISPALWQGSEETAANALALEISNSLTRPEQEANLKQIVVMEGLL